MTDRELLEMAAKAAGIKLFQWVEKGQWQGEPDEEGFQTEPPESDRWNPLADDGDALRLAVKLRIGLVELVDTIVPRHCRGVAWKVLSAHCSLWEPEGDDAYAATRRAIVRAAAEIGRQMDSAGG